MPAKRKAPTGRSGASSGGGGGATSAGNKRQSKLAKEHNITAQEEADIKEAFSLFAEPMEGEKEGVIPIEDVRRAMIALGIPPKDSAEHADFVSILDPDDEGFAQYPSFVAICALKLHARHRGSEVHAREVDDAFALFTHGASSSLSSPTPAAAAAPADADDDHDDIYDYEEEAGGQWQKKRPTTTTTPVVITMAHLRRVAAMIREDDVSDGLLRDMILEANGGAGVARGVTRDEFETVMRRAGVWR